MNMNNMINNLRIRAIKLTEKESSNGKIIYTLKYVLVLNIPQNNRIYCQQSYTNKEKAESMKAKLYECRFISLQELFNKWGLIVAHYDEGSGYWDQSRLYEYTQIK